MTIPYEGDRTIAQLVGILTQHERLHVNQSHEKLRNEGMVSVMENKASCD